MQAGTPRRFICFRDSVATVIDTILRNGYSQIQEFEADQEALILLALSGYNPGALVDRVSAYSSISSRGGAELAELLFDFS